MNSYLGRPVFEFEINWSDPVNKRFAFDLAELQLGFGAPVFTSLQEHTVQGYKLQIDLATDEAIKTCDAFFSTLFGRLNGFWLPAPFEGMQISSAEDATHFRIVDQGLADAWNAQADLHLIFSSAGVSPAAAKITAVTDLGNGYERVTLNSAVNLSLLTPAATVKRLHYVRLADDVERAKFIADGWQRRQINVVELPLEYAAAETGQRPVWLYRFTLGHPAIAIWTYTSFAANFISIGKNYTTAAMTHGAIREGLKLENETTTVEAAFDLNHPLALFLPFAPSAPMFVEIIEVDYGAPNTQYRRFHGQVRSVKDHGDRLVAECESFISVLNRKFPRALIQPECNWHLFDANCKLNRASFTQSRQITSLDANDNYPPVVYLGTLDGLEEEKPDNYYRGGLFYAGNGAKYEARTIIAYEFVADLEFRHKFTLNLPLVHAWVNDQAHFTPGCDGKIATCQAFNNFNNFGGFPYVPTRNPALVALDLPVSKGGKK